MASFYFPPTGGSGGGSGTVTSLSIVSTNGFAGTVSNPTTTPAITLSTTITGILQGNGTAISAATTGNLTSTPTTNLVVTGGTGAVLGSGALLTLTGASLVEATSAVLTITGGTNAVLGTGVSIQVKQAATAQSGYLSSTDWNTFNGKQAAGNYITALTGDGTASGPGSVALTLATVNTNTGAFGSATQVAAFTVNAKGLTTAASNISIQIAESQVTNLTTDLAAKITNPMTSLGDSIYGGTAGAPTQLAGNITSTKKFLVQTGTGSVSAAPAWGTISQSDVPQALLTSAHLFVGNVSGLATDTAITGDVTIGNTGVTAIGTNKVTNSQLAQMATNTIKGNNTGSTANAADLTIAQLTALFPATTTSFVTTGSHSGGFSANASGNYTTPANVRALIVWGKAGGGGGGGSGLDTALGGTGGTGSTTTFGTSLLTANGGVGGAPQSAGPLGGTATIGAGASGIVLQGQGGQSAPRLTAPNILVAGGTGGGKGGGPGGLSGAAVAAGANTGGGGGGGGGFSSALGQSVGPGGGEGGEFQAVIIPTAGQVFAYVCGGGGSAGAAGSGTGFAGTAGAGGFIYVTELQT